MACPSGWVQNGSCPDGYHCDLSSPPCGDYYPKWIDSYIKCDLHDINCPNFVCTDCYWNSSSYGGCCSRQEAVA
ncbi:MAG: hypothetical protein K0Q73_8442 [Paenibacillus sp.]|jgi:hypothetical protein|nr:hypothetical protein [Paenibacillus sp.]